MAGKSAEGFAADLDLFLQGALDRQDVLVRRVMSEAAQSVILKTPVDTGRARANWIAAEDEASTETSESTDANGQSALAAANLVIAGAPRFGRVVLANSLPYIGVLENGGFVPTDPGPSKKKGKGGKGIKGRTGETLVSGGFSVQAPEGMVKKTVQELEARYAG